MDQTTSMNNLSSAAKTDAGKGFMKKNEINKMVGWVLVYDYGYLSENDTLEVRVFNTYEDAQKHLKNIKQKDLQNNYVSIAKNQVDIISVTLTPTNKK